MAIMTVSYNGVCERFGPFRVYLIYTYYEKIYIYIIVMNCVRAFVV